MAKAQSLPEVAEMKIPVFTVLKNGAILKNIFIVNKTPEVEPLASSVQDHDHWDHILIVGRHPDCNITLTHPSISRFHLQIRSNPCTQKLIVLDLSSVHGTWVSGRKIEAGMCVEMKESDTLRIGASSRLYRLHWIPVSRAYDLENPFASELNLAVEEEKGQEDDALPEEEEKEMTQNESLCPIDNEEVQSMDSILESIKCLFTHENLELIGKQEIRSEDCISSYCDDKESCPPDEQPEDKTTSGLFGTETSHLPTNSISENKVCNPDLQFLVPPRVESVFECGDLNNSSQGPQKMPNSSVNSESLFHAGEENQAYSGEEVPKETNILSTLGDYLRESICFPVVEAVQGTKMQQFQGVQQNSPFSTFTSQLPPVKQKVPFEKHSSNKLTNLDPASFDLTGAAVGAELPKETESGCTLRDDEGRHIITTGAENLITENTFLPVEEATQEMKFQPIEVSVDSVSGSEKQINCCQDHESNLQPYQNYIPCNEQGHSTDGIIQAVVDKCNNNISLNSVPAESSITSLSEQSIMEISNKKENQTRRSLNAMAGCSEKKILEKGVKTICQPIEVALDSVSRSAKRINRCQDHSNFQPYLNSLPCNVQGHSMDGIIQNVGDKCNNNISLISVPAESSITSLSEESVKEISNKKENQTQRSLDAMAACTEKKILEKSVETRFQPIEVAMDSVSHSEKQIICCQDQSNFQAYQTSILCNAHGHSMDGIVRDVGEECNNNLSLISLPAESTITSLSEKTIMETSNKKVIQTQRSPNAIAGCSRKKILEKSVESIENNIWSRRGKATSAPQIRTSKSRIKNTANVDNEVETSYQKVVKEKAKAKDLLSVLDGEQEIFTPDKENFSPNTLQLRFQKKGKLEANKHYKSRQRSHNSENHLRPEIYLGEISFSEKENQTLEVVQEQKSERKPFGSYIKLEHIDMSNQKDITDKTAPKNILAELDEEEDEYHTLDKENFSPNTLQLLLLEKKGKLHVPGLHSSNTNLSSNITSGKENQTSKVAREQKSKRKPFGNCIEFEQEQDAWAQESRLERLPLQFQLTKSGGKIGPKTSRSVFAAENISANTCAQILDESNNPPHVSERSWNMVIDTASLVKKESRKALMLLQGLKGTRLIIPRIVIKELDSMKRQFSFFRRTSEASLALEWIDECMVKTKWWIHVQSSIEEGMLIAPTPPAIPPTPCNEEGWNFHLSSHKSSMEIVSPTVEDHTLDYVLTYRRKQNDGQFVLLSDDVTLKIKSMAEGLLCETVEEFRDSLVNPFSERFLWADSSPRGQTWSCKDDVVLREKYCRLPSRKSSKGEGAKGLKLILLHNSRYGRLNSAC